MPSSTLPRHLLLATPLALTALLTGCGGESGGGSAQSVKVTAGDDSCQLSETDLAAGPTTFAVTNEGSKVTEVYVYGESGGAFTKVVSEVENIGPGTSRDMDVDLAAGSYEIACKPGQKGDGIRETVTVTGDGGSKAGSGDASEGGYDRELELTAEATALTGLDDPTAAVGERIEFKLHNTTDATRTLEVIDPAGTVVAEFDVPAGEVGEAIVELADPGAWVLKLEGGAEEIEATLTVA